MMLCLKSIPCLFLVAQSHSWFLILITLVKMSTEGFFRKSTFCTLTDTNPGFDGHWVMPKIFLLNGTFTMLEMTAFLLNTFFNSMHCCKMLSSFKSKIGNVYCPRYILELLTSVNCSVRLSFHRIVGFQFFLQPMVYQYLLHKTLGIAQRSLYVSGILCQVPMDQRLP